MPSPLRTRRLLLAAATAAVVAGVFWRNSTTVDHGPLTAPSPLATWPWQHATVTSPHPGVTCWTDTSLGGTGVRLIEFDFASNPRLRFALYDQDQDDTKPFDDSVDYWNVGVAQATAHLNATGRGPVVAASNGLFFSTDFGKPPLPPNYPKYGYAHHVGPTVENGVVRYNVGNPRWTFGVDYGRDGSPSFRTIFRPDRRTLARSFTYAAAGAQCLIKDGKPLKLQPFPNPDAPVDAIVPSEQARIASSPDRAGDIPTIDLVKTSRVSFGWSRDSSKLYLLFVRQQGTEARSIQAFQMLGVGSHAQSRGRMLAQGGWDLADEQQFWERLGVWGAVNSDGGEVAQLALIRSDGKYDVYPSEGAQAGWIPGYYVPGQTAPPSTLTPPSMPGGGSLMYWYVYESLRGGLHPAEKALAHR